jgi:hypothetical protein
MVPSLATGMPVSLKKAVSRRSAALKKTGLKDVGALKTSSPALIQSSRECRRAGSKAMTGACWRSQSW